MTDDLEMMKQTFSAVEQVYDVEPVDSTPVPTPGFWRRASNHPPAGSEPLFVLDEEVARTEYDH